MILVEQKWVGNTLDGVKTLDGVGAKCDNVEKW